MDKVGLFTDNLISFRLLWYPGYSFYHLSKCITLKTNTQIIFDFLFASTCILIPCNGVFLFQGWTFFTFRCSVTSGDLFLSHFHGQRIFINDFCSSKHYIPSHFGTENFNTIRLNIIWPEAQFSEIWLLIMQCTWFIDCITQYLTLCCDLIFAV